MEVTAGAYTGNFVAYKDGTIRHAGVNVAGLDRTRALDVRAILQSSEHTVADQHAGLDEEQTAVGLGSYPTVQIRHRPDPEPLESEDDE